MNKRRIGLFKTALEAMTETDQAVAEDQPTETPTETGSPVDPIKTDEIQPEPVQQEAPVAEAAAAPEQAPAEVQVAITEVVTAATEETPPTATGEAPTPEEVANAPETSISTGVTTDEDPALDDCGVADITDEVAELAIKGSELNEDGKSIADAVDAVEELEDLVQTAEASGVEGEGAAAVLDLAVEHIFNRIGLENHYLSMESEGGTTISQKLTHIKEVIIHLIKALIEAVKRAAFNAKEYLRRLNGVAQRTARAAQAMQKDVRALRDYPAQGKIANQRLQRQIAVSRDTSISKAFQNLNELVIDANKSMRSGYVAHLNKIVEVFMQGHDADRLVDEFPQVLQKAFNDALPNNQLDNAFDIENIPEGGYILTSDLLPGNAVGVLVIPKTTADLRVFSYTIEHASSSSELELDVLSKSEMAWLLDTIANISNSVAAADKYVMDMGRLETHLSASVKKLDKNVEAVTPEFRSFIQAVSATAPALARGIHEKSFAYAMQCCSAGLRYVEASLRKQQGKE